MNVITFFIPQTQSTLIEQPIERRFHHITILAETAAMPGITSCNLRRYIMLPQPISVGRYSHGVPVFSTKRIPVKQARSEIRGRPPLGLGGSGGICDFICSHSSSVSSGFAIIISSMTLFSVCLLMSFRINRYSIFRFC